MKKNKVVQLTFEDSIYDTYTIQQELNSEKIEWDSVYQTSIKDDSMLNARAFIEALKKIKPDMCVVAPDDLLNSKYVNFLCEVNEVYPITAMLDKMRSIEEILSDMKNDTAFYDSLVAFRQHKELVSNIEVNLRNQNALYGLLLVDDEKTNPDKIAEEVAHNGGLLLTGLKINTENVVESSIDFLTFIKDSNKQGIKNFLTNDKSKLFNHMPFLKKYIEDAGFEILDLDEFVTIEQTIETQLLS